MNRKLLIATLVLVPFIVFLYGMRPIYKPDLSSCEITEGIVSRLHEGGEFDLVIKLKGQPHSYYYINRGLENSFSMSEIQAWKHQNARIWYVERWVLKMLGNTSWHIARVDIKGQTVFDETREPPIP